MAYEDVYEHGIEDMLHRIPSTEKIDAAIGWPPERTLDDILADVIAFERGRADVPPGEARWTATGTASGPYGEPEASAAPGTAPRRGSSRAP